MAVLIKMCRRGDAVLTGAGMSTEQPSNIPDYRSPNGRWAGRCAAHDRVWNMLVLVSMPHMFCSAKNKDDVSMNTARVYGSYSRGHKPITWQQFSKSVRASAAVATLVQRCGKFLTQTNLHKLPCAGVHARRSRHVATRGAMPLACYDTLVQHSIHHAIHQ